MDEGEVDDEAGEGDEEPDGLPDGVEVEAHGHDEDLPHHVDHCQGYGGLGGVSRGRGTQIMNVKNVFKLQTSRIPSIPFVLKQNNYNRNCSINGF